MPYLDMHKTITVSGIESCGEDAVGRDFLSRKPDWVQGNISEYDSRFLSGLTLFANAQRVVEIGVASGWSSAILLRALSRTGNPGTVTGIDLFPNYYLDASIPVGRAVYEAVPELASNYRLLTGCLAFDAMSDVGKVDFAFIDGHHMHPWATLDMLSILPFIEQGRWVAMHDVNICTFERHQHKHRGPFYLFYMWPDQKLHSTQEPTMIGAVLIERSPEEYLPTLLEILYTPWEIDVDPAALQRLAAFIGGHFGPSWLDKFSKAFQDCRGRFNAHKE